MELPNEAKKQIINRNLNGLKANAYDLEIAIKINTDLDIKEQETEQHTQKLKDIHKQMDAYEKLLEELE